MDTEAFLEHSHFVRRLARSLILDEHLAEDIVQQTWMAAFSNPPAERGALRTWLGKVTRNFSLRWIRSERRREARERAYSTKDRYPSPDEILVREKEKLGLVEAVQAMEEPYRSTIVYRFYEDLKPREIAKRLGVPVETVKTRIQRGLQQLRRRLDAAHEGDRRQWCLALAPVAGLQVFANAAGGATASISTLSGALLMTAKWKIAFIAALILTGVFTIFILLPMKEEKGFDATKLLSPNSAASRPGAAEDAGGSDQVREDTRRERTSVASSLFRANFKGQVLTRNTGLAVTDATVTITRLPIRSDVEPTRDRTDPAGHFEIPVFAETPDRITAFHVHISSTGFKTFETRIPFSTEEGEIDCGAIYLKEERLHVITVVDTGGRAVAGARLKLFIPRNDTPFVEKTADAAGRIEITDEEVERKIWRSFELLMQIGASGMADHFHRIVEGDEPPFPRSITLAPEGDWTGIVIDKEKQKGLEGVEVLVHLFNRSLGTRLVRTDASGRYRIPRFTHSKNADVEDRTPHSRITVRTEGYLPYQRFLKKIPIEIPERILLEEAGLMQVAIAVDVSTGVPLANHDMQIVVNFHRLEITTDEAGCFRFPVMAGEKNTLRVRAPGYSLYRTRLYPDDVGDKRFPVFLVPVVQQEMKFIVKDELGRPVPGARIDFLYYYDPVHTDTAGIWGGIADRSGEFTLSLYAMGKTDGRLTISRPGFCTLGPLRIPLGPGCDTLRTFVLKMGSTFQNIKVVDDQGLPLRGKTVVAALDLEEGELLHVEGVSDPEGFCDLGMPAFVRGRVYVKDREDTAVNITYPSIMRNELITVILPEEEAGRYTVHGRVLDEMGRPLPGIQIDYGEMGDDEGTERRLYTAPDGSFRFPAFRDTSYRLSFPEYWNFVDGFYYRSEDLTHVSSDTPLEITLQSIPCVRVDLEFFEDRYGPDFEYDIWLEDDRGRKLDAGETIKTGFFIDFFLDPPGCAFQVVVQSTALGVRYHTPTFELTNGRGMDIDDDVPWTKK